MRYSWIDYGENYAPLVETWLDEETRRETGCDDGFARFDEYWRNDGETVAGENYWCKLVCEGGSPFAVIAVGMNGDEMTVMELIVAPEKRGLGFGSSALAELLLECRAIIGRGAALTGAVIYPDNRASQRAFEKAGFVFDRAHPDGDAWYYVYRAPSVR